MSMEIDIDNFANFTSIFEEIERRNRQTMEANPAVIHKKVRKTKSEAMAQPDSKIYNQERKPGSFTMYVSRPDSSKHSSLGRRASDSTSDKLRVPQNRERIRSAPCPVIDREKLKDEPRLTEAAKKLSDEELTLLYEDILKPLDFYSILHERRKEREELNP